MPNHLARLGIWSTALAMLLGALGCEELAEDEPPDTKAAAAPAPPRVKVKDLVERLRGPDARLRLAAERQLMGMAGGGFAPKDGVRLLRAAAQPGPKGREAVPAILVRAAATRPGPDDVPVVVELFPRYDTEARRAALTLLARLPDRDAAEALVNLLGAFAGTPALAAMPIGTLVDEPRHADILFPRLLDHLRRPELLPGICRIALACADADMLTGRTLAPFADRLVDEAASRLDALAGMEDGDPPGDTLPRGAPELRREVCLLLDLLGRVPTTRGEDVARRALAGADPEVEAHAIVALLRQAKPVEPGAVALAASRPEVRLWLWTQLQDLNRSDLFPARFRTEAALAESELVGWLAESDELGRAPDDIEPMGTLTAQEGPDPPRQYYLFRFRVRDPHPLARRGWLAGWVSYPAHRGRTSTGLAGSRFLPWDAMTPRAHLVPGRDPENGETDDDSGM